MRLPEAQVKEAILSHDRDVREAAVYYFTHSHSTDSGIMPLAIQVIEQYGWKDAFEFYSFMQDLVQTDKTISWLIAQIKNYGQATDEHERRFAHSASNGLVQADIAILERHQAEIINIDELEDEAQFAIRQRLQFASQPPEELWDHLDFFCDRSDQLDEVPDDLDAAYFLAEALGRHPEFTVQRILPILAGETGHEGKWLELFAVRLAGEIRMQEAIPAIVALHEKPDDWIFEEGHRALVKIGGNKVVEEFARVYPTADTDLRSSAASILENIHSDLSVKTCLTFFESEQDHRIRCSLLQSVLMNFSNEGIEPARQLILCTPLDPEVLEVRSDLLIACKLLGERFPELEAWEEDAKKDSEFRKNWYRKMTRLDEFELGEEEDDEEAIEPPDTIAQQAHVGRNDPCPCGSGRKFKKCCIGKRTASPENDVENAATIAASAQKRVQYPIGTVAFYGPDDKVTTKIVAAIIRKAEAEPILERWVGTNLKQNPKVQRQVHEFLDRHGAKSVAITDRNLGCPHEEGEDFPLGEDCPFCPFWAGKQGSNRRD